MSNPLISIIMTTRNGASKGPRNGEWLSEALESALSQEYDPFEIVLYSDGSTDNTEKIARDIAAHSHDRLRVYAAQNGRGISHGLNFAASQARGEWLVPFGDDDLIEPLHLSELVNYVERYRRLNGGETIGLCGQWLRIVDVNGKLRNELTSCPIECRQIAISLSHGRFETGVLAVRRDVWDALGGYDTRLKYAADYDIAVRAVEAGHLIYCVPRVTYQYRMTGAGNVWNVSAQNQPEHFEEFQQVYRAHRERMEKSGRMMAAPKKGLLHEFKQ